MKKTLLERARGVAVRGNYPAEELALALAFMRGRVTGLALARTVKIYPNNVAVWVFPRIKWAVRNGLLELTEARPEGT